MPKSSILPSVDTYRLVDGLTLFRLCTWISNRSLLVVPDHLGWSLGNIFIFAGVQPRECFCYENRIGGYRMARGFFVTFRSDREFPPHPKRELVFISEHACFSVRKIVGVVPHNRASRPNGLASCVRKRV